MDKKILTFAVFLLVTTHLAAKSTLQELTERQNFLAELLVRIQTETVLNHEANKRMTSCLSGVRKSPDCQIARTQVFEQFPEVVREARLHLAMGYRDGVFSGGFFKVNSRLHALGTYKDIKWFRLTPQEDKVAHSLMDRYIREARAEAAKNPKIGSSGPKYERFLGLAVRKRRVAHLQLYKDLISQIILLQYVQEDQVNKQILGDAFGSLMDRSTKELNTISKAARIAEGWIQERRDCAETVDYQMRNPSGSPIFMIAACIQTPPELLSLLDYRAAVEGLLIDYPQFEKVVESFHTERKARAILTVSLVALPTLVISTMAPPLIAISANVAAGGLALLTEQNNYNKIRRRELSKVVNPTGNVDWEALKNGRLSRNISAALIPFVGAGKYVSPLLKNATSPAARYITGMVKFKYFRFASR